MILPLCTARAKAYNRRQQHCQSVSHVTLTARDCPHCKPNSVATQKKCDAAWAEQNIVQAGELQKINKLIQETKRLRTMADTANIAVSDVEDWGSEDDSRAAKGATVTRNHCSLSSPSCVIPSLFIPKSQTSHSNRICLLLLYHIHVSLRHTLKLLPARKCTFHLFFPQRHVWTHTQTVSFCHAHVQNLMPLRSPIDYG